MVFPINSNMQVQSALPASLQQVTPKPNLSTENDSAAFSTKQPEKDNKKTLYKVAAGISIAALATVMIVKHRAIGEFLGIFEKKGSKVADNLEDAVEKPVENIIEDSPVNEAFNKTINDIEVSIKKFTESNIKLKAEISKKVREFVKRDDVREVLEFKRQVEKLAKNGLKKSGTKEQRNVALDLLYVRSAIYKHLTYMFDSSIANINDSRFKGYFTETPPDEFAKFIKEAKGKSGEEIVKLFKEPWFKNIENINDDSVLKYIRIITGRTDNPNFAQLHHVKLNDFLMSTPMYKSVEDIKYNQENIETFKLRLERIKKEAAEAGQA